MKINKRIIISFVAPLMILVSAMGLLLRANNRKIFYLPIGLMGISIINSVPFPTSETQLKLPPCFSTTIE